MLFHAICPQYSIHPFNNAYVYLGKAKPSLGANQAREYLEYHASKKVAGQILSALDVVCPRHCAQLKTDISQYQLLQIREEVQTVTPILP